MPFVVSGVTRDKATGDPLGGCAVYLLKYDSGADTLTQVDSGVSNGSGDYQLVALDGDAAYSVAAFDESASPVIAGMTERDLTPADIAGLDYLWLGALTADGITASAKMEAAVTTSRLAVSTSSDMTSPVYSSAVVPDATYNIAKYTITGLTADTTYHCAVEVDGVIDIATKGTFKTFPSAAAFSFKFALAGDALTGSTHDVFDTIRAQSPQFFFHLGDMHYEDIATGSEALFHAAYDDVFDSAKQHQLYREIPSPYVWDDHDYGPNDSHGGSAPREAAIAAYRRRVPHYPLVEAGATDAIYHSFEVGRVVFIVTDQRSEASPATATDDASKTVLGATQKAWFKSILSDEGNASKLFVWVCSRVWGGVASAGKDHWGGFTTERTELADYIHANCPGRLVVLSADMHSLAIDDGTNHDFVTSGSEPIKTFQAAPLDRTETPEAQTYGGATYSEGQFLNNGQFGAMEVTDAGGSSITIDWTGYTSAGAELVTYQFVIDLVLSISATPVTSATEDEAYAGFTATASGGLAPYTFSVASGALPTGITLNTSTGEVSGTPTVNGTFADIVLRVTDDASATADLDPFTLTVAEADVTAPVLSSPTASETGATTASLSVTTDEDNETLSVVVVPTAATAPDAGQVMAGTDGSDSAATFDTSQAVSTTGVQTIAGGATGLTAGTAYKAYFAQQDAAGNNSNVAASAEFTTEAGVALELDGIDNIFAVHSLKRVLTSWEGDLVRILRALDDAEQDFGPDGTGWVDVAAVTDFTGGGTAYITAVYDQKGNSINAVPSGASFRPVLNVSGANPTIDFGGVSDRLVIPTGVGFARNAAACSVVVVGKADDTSTATKILFFASTDTATPTKILLGTVSTANHRVGGRTNNADSFAAVTGFTADTDWHVHIARFDYANAELHYRRDSETETLDPFQDAEPTSDTDSAGICYGTNFNGGDPWLGEMTLGVLISDLLTAQEESDLATALAALKL